MKSNRGAGPARHSLLSEHTLSQERSSPKTSKVKAKGQTSGRTYTSKYRGVHQTFPTKRWEAQFRLGVPLHTKTTPVAALQIAACLQWHQHQVSQAGGGGSAIFAGAM